MRPPHRRRGRYRFSPDAPARPATVPGPANRRILLVVLGLIVTGVLVGWLARGSDSGGSRGGRGAGSERAGRTPDRDVGPSGGMFSGRRRAPTAADILGALKSAPRSGLVRIEGRVVDALSREPVADVEVVFAGAAGETTTTAGADGAYAIDVERGDYRAFVRGDHVISVGAAPWERLPAPPDPTAASAPDDQLAPLVEVTTAQRGVDLEVQRSGVVIGRVLDRNGRPVVGAVVRAAVGHWRPVLGTHISESDSTGAFRLEVPGGYYDLEAAHPDFAGPELVGGYQRPNVMVYPAMETTIDLTLASGCVVTGRVIRRDGTPAGAGALERGNGVDFWPAGPIADDGTFRFTTVAEEELHLRAWPWKAPPAPAQVVSCRDGMRHVVEFVVPDVSPDLTGKILDASGDPMPAAYIDIYGLSPGTMNQQERADSAGDWAVFALPPGDYSVTAHVPGRGVATASVSVPGRDVVLRLSGTGALEGSIEGVADGTTFQLEIAGCVSSSGGSVVMQATTRVVPVFGGTYRVDNLPACTLVANARSPLRSAPVHAEIVAGRVATADIDLSPPRAKQVKVSVTDEDGDAVPNAQVMVAHLDGNGTSPPDQVTTDSRGLATVEAHVGDIITAFSYDPTDPDSVPYMGQYTVSDAIGSTEEADIQLAGSGYWDN